MKNSVALFEKPSLLTKQHDSSSFNSGEPVLDEWLRDRAWNNLQISASRTYVICPTGTQKIIGYFALSMGQVLTHEVIGSMRRNMPKHIPAIILGRLAIDQEWQKKGLGRALISEVIRRSLLAASEVSARLIVIHALSPAAEAFYLHHGFTRLPVENPTLALDLIKLQQITAMT